MSETAVALDQRMIQLVLPSIPESVRIARFHIRAALAFHRLGEYADDAGIITSELVTNAIQHVAEDPEETIGITLARVRHPMAAVAVIVSDSSRELPIRRETSAVSERGRGLQIVEALSVRWGWIPEPGGKVIFAVIGTEGRDPQGTGAACTSPEPRRPAGNGLRRAPAGPFTRSRRPEVPLT